MTPTATIIIISILCALIGILAAYIFMSKPKRKPINKPKSHREPKEEAEKQPKQPVEFSKKILMVTFGIAVIIIGFAMYIIYLGAVSGYGSDSTTLNTLLVSIFGELSVGTGFYYWKSRKENIIKLESTYGRTVDEADAFTEPNDLNDNYPI